jgi:hypothetical protein
MIRVPVTGGTIEVPVCDTVEGLQELVSYF